MPRSITREEKHPELFARDQYTDPRARKRKAPMEVLCLGYMRTGTASMQTAFNLLGISCCHSFSLYNHVKDCAMWISAFDAKFAGNGEPFTRVQWDQLLAEYGAVTDVPALAFSEDLIAAYPEAKVVLMERNIESWYTSFDDAVIKVMWGRWGHLIASLDPWFVRPIRDVHLCWAKHWMGVNSAEEMRMKAKTKYREHYELIRKIVPRERLLEYQLSSGWEPLCDFLKKEVPYVEFPKVNETAAMHEKITIIMIRGIRNSLIRFLWWSGPLILAVLVASNIYVGNAASAHVTAAQKILANVGLDLKVGGEAFFITDDARIRFWDPQSKIRAAAGDKTPLTDVYVVPAWVGMALATTVEYLFLIFTPGQRLPPKTLRRNHKE